MTLHKRLQHAALFVAAFAAIAFGSLNVFAARIPLGALTTVNTSTHLDPMFIELYDLRERITTPSYTGSTPQATIDSSGRFAFGGTTAGNGGGADTLSTSGAIGTNGLQFNAKPGASTNFEFVNRSSAAGWNFYVNSGSQIALTIDGSGNVLSSTAALGYGTGSGGTVTQATSKSTAVTLNKATGQITTHNASLASGASVAFTLNNSLISAGDTMVVHVYGAAGGAANYEVRPSGGAGGSISIVLKNVSGGALAEGVVISFALLKVATT